MRIGLLLVGAGFLLTFVGAGTADMETAAGEKVGLFTGLPLAILGLAAFAAGIRLLTLRRSWKGANRS